MGENNVLKVATPETVEAIKAEVEQKINDAAFGGISIEPITAKEVHAIFTKADGETE